MPCSECMPCFEAERLAEFFGRAPQGWMGRVPPGPPGSVTSALLTRGRPGVPVGAAAHAAAWSLARAQSNSNNCSAMCATAQSLERRHCGMLADPAGTRPGLLLGKLARAPIHERVMDWDNNPNLTSTLHQRYV